MMRALTGVARATGVSVLTLAAATSSRAHPRSAVATIEVGRNVQVSAAHAGDTHYEVHAAADSRNPGSIVVGSIVYPANGLLGNAVVYASIDGGETWRPTLEGAKLENTGDPALAYGGDGSAYYTASSIPPSGADRTMLFFRSRDGGRTWTDTSRLTYTDRQYVTVDATGGKYDGRIYVNGSNRIPRDISDFVVFSSTNGGRTFVGPGKREGFAGLSAQSMGNAVVLSDGTLLGVFSETRGGRSTLSAIASVDGGATLTSAVTIGDFNAGGNRKGADNNVNSQPILAVDATRGTFRDRLYVVWPDRRSGHSQILFAASADRGKSWSEPRAINDNLVADSTDQLMPAVAVNRDGAVGVIWYDRRNHPDNLGWDVRFTASLDGGGTFAPSVDVSRGGTRFEPTTPWTALRPTVTRATGGFTLRVSLNTFMFLGGDTSGLAADATGVFHAVWVDNRTGVPQVWSAPIIVRAGNEHVTAPAQAPSTRDQQSIPASQTDARAKPATAPDAAGGRAGPELSDKVTVVVTRASYARRGEVLTIAAHLENRSSERVAGPFILRAHTVQAELGDPVAINADNGVRGAGAEWLFSSAALPPSGMSGERVMTFALANLRPFREGRLYRLGVLELSAGVYPRR